MEEKINKGLDIQQEEYIDLEEPTTVGGILGIVFGLLYLFVVPSFIANIISIFFNNNSNSYTSSLLSIIAQLLAAILVTIWIYLANKSSIHAVLKGINIKTIVKGLAFGAITYFACIGVSYIITAIFGEGLDNANQSNLNSIYFYAPIIAVTFTCIFAPIVEELIFRFSLFKTLLKKNKILAYIITVLCFAFIHLLPSITQLISSRDLDTFLNDLQTLPIYAVGSLIFCFAYDKEKHFAVNLFAHIAYNFMCSLVIFASFFTAPIRVKKIEVTNKSIILNMNENSKYNVKYDFIELTDYDGNQVNTEVNYKDSKVEILDLDPNTYYSFVIHFSYNDGEKQVYTVDGYATTEEVYG